MEPSSEVRAAYLRVVAAMSRGDATAFTAMLSQEAGAVLIGTAPEEWMEGPDAIGRLVRRAMPALGRAGLTFEEPRLDRILPRRISPRWRCS